MQTCVQADPGFEAFAQAVQRALVEAVTRLNLLFAQRGVTAGCTATLVLQVRECARGGGGWVGGGGHRVHSFAHAGAAGAT